MNKDCHSCKVIDFLRILLHNILNTCLSCNTKQKDSQYQHECVDLGLSVKWAACNVGADRPEDYGDYYAWGEVETKANYYWNNYRFYLSDGKNGNLNLYKYNSKCENTTLNNKTILAPEDDAAHVKWGENWRMPTKEDFEELINNCSWKSVRIRKVWGYKVTSLKEGYTDHYIFLPAVGYRRSSSNYCVGYGCYWSSSLNTSNPECAWLIDLYANNYFLDEDERYYGFAIRPVCL